MVLARDLGSVGLILLFGSLAISPLMLLIFRRRVMGGGFWRNLVRMVRDYWGHVLIFGVLYLQKNYVDALNDPVRGVFGDFTFLLARLEGDLVLHIQQALEHTWLTAALNFNYLFAYIFITYFSMILAAYDDDRELASKLVLNVLIIYLLAVPFYVFFNIQITSDFIPQMRSLLYHSSSSYLAFFTAADPLDNAWPSLHIAIPYGFFLLLYWTMRDRGHRFSTWGYNRYLALVGIELVIFAFSILYLGIHWILDIPGGLLIGYTGALIVEEVHEEVFDRIYGTGDWIATRVRGLWRALSDATGIRR